MSLQNKIDFALIFSVKNANPNGDPLNGNRPRTDYDGFGEVSDVCLKRKIRDRLQDSGEPIFVQSDEKKTDGMPSLKVRAESDEYGLGKNAFNVKKTPPEETARLANEKWLDVRSFGQLFVDICRRTGEMDLAEEAERQISDMESTVESHGWDGDWFVRAFSLTGRISGTGYSYWP